VVKAANAYSKIKKSRIGVIGDLFPNLVSCRYDPTLLNSRLGITLLPFSFESLRSTIRTFANQAQTPLALNKKIAGSCQFDPVNQDALDAGIRLHMALKRMAAEHEIDGFATECWSGFPRELGMNPCLGFIEDDYELACEGDVMLCIALLIVRYLTGRRAFAGDLFDLTMEGLLTLIHCGAPASLCGKEDGVILAKSSQAQERGFETITCRPVLERGPVTLLRVNGMGCDKLHLAFGELVHCERSSNLAVQVKLIGNRWDFLDQCFGNHYLVAAGDIRDELKLLCKWLGISVFET
jgi:L-fucose isomerase-like protein